MKPYDWQQRLLIDPCVEALQRPLKVAINAACCGAGKTVCILATAQQANLNPMIICPKAVKSSWARHCKAMDIEPIGIETIEKLRYGNTPYLKRLGKKFIWQLDPETSLIVFDESHKANGDGLNGAILGATWQRVINKERKVITQQFPTLLASATLATDPLGLRYYTGYRLGLHKYTDATTWLRKNGCYVRTIRTARGERYFYEFPTGDAAKPHLEKLNAYFFPDFGVTLKQSEIPGFAEHNIFAESYDLDPKDLRSLKKIYDELQVKRSEAAGITFAEVLYDKMGAELLKAPLFIDLVNQHLAEGMSPIVMVNHRETHHAIARAFPEAALIIGDQKPHERDNFVQDFLADKRRVCISTISAGGTGLDLNDQHGNFPRVMLVSPTYSSKDFLQAVGRHHRNNNKTPALTKVVLAARTIEDRIRKKLSGKLQNGAILTDTDFLPI